MVRPLVCALLLAASGVTAVSSRTHQSFASVPADPSAVGYLNLTKRHPDGLEGRRDFEESFTTAAALQRSAEMREFLKSFSVLTDRVRRQQGPSMLEGVGHTGSEMQTIGFHNIPLVIEGTLLKQAYQIAQTRYELALAHNAEGRTTDRDVAEARRVYEEATRRFQVFWDTKRPGD